LAAEFLVIRRDTAASGMGALLCSGHTISPQLRETPSFSRNQGLVDVVTLKSGHWVSSNREIFLRKLHEWTGGSGEVSENTTLQTPARIDFG
jgi:hypothetical protein